jgi:Xaa-Pro aminopeptidase
LFVEPPSGRETLGFYNDNVHGELWVGARPSLDEVAAALGLDVRPLSELTAPVEENRRLNAVLSELRLLKDPWEVAQIEAAIEVTIRGFEDVGAALAGHADERLVETIFAARARRDGNDVAFNPIAAGGAHATTLHWTRNDSPLRRGELLLLDAGAESHTLYAADLTRTYPVSRTFTDVQRRVLELLNDAQDAALAAIAPGRSYRDFRYAVAEVMTAGLPELGISTDGVPQDFYRRFTICGPGHMLGLDVHDCHHARASTYLDGVLEPGHVLTVEPGLYFQANDLTIPEELRGIGMRVEDDVVVTEDGIRNLSAGLPRRAAEIEGWLTGL